MTSPQAVLPLPVAVKGRSVNSKCRSNQYSKQGSERVIAMRVKRLRRSRAVSFCLRSSIAESRPS